MPLTDDQVIAGYYNDAMNLLTSELQLNHIRGLVGHCICKKCFSCVCGVMLKFRNAQARVAKMERDIQEALSKGEAPEYYTCQDGEFRRYSTPNGISLAHALRLEQELKNRKHFAIIRQYGGDWYVYKRIKEL